MIPEQELVERIREQLRTDPQQVTPLLEDLAEQYADACAIANARLSRCAEFLAKGMRSEAVHEAEGPPSVLTLVDVISFQELAKWRNFCLDLGLDAFPDIDFDTVEKLRGELATEEALSPLLRKYRRLVHDGDSDGCIEVLRELRLRDPESPVWPENLQRLEEQQLRVLVPQVQDAIAGGDLAEVRRLNVELTHPQRVAPVPKDLLSESSATLQGGIRQALEAEMTSLMVDLERVLSDRDVERAGYLLGRWDELSAEGSQMLSSAHRALLSQVTEWHDREMAQRRQEQAFQDAVASMWEAVGTAEPDANTVNENWQTLSGFGQPLPDALARSVQEAFARIAARKRRRATRNVCLVVLFLILAAAGAAASVWARRRAQDRQQTLAHLAGLKDQGQYEEMRSFLDALKDRDLAFYNSPELRPLVDETDRVLAEQGDRAERFAKLTETLSTIRENGFAATEERIRAVLAEARECASGAANTALLQAWQGSWERWRTRKIQGADEELRRIQASIRQGLEARKRQPFSSILAEGQALERLNGIRREAAEWVSRASPEMVETFGQVAAELEAWGREYADRCKSEKAAQERLKSLRKRLLSALPNLDLYGQLLEQFVREFPDTEESAPFRRAFHEFEHYRRTAALQMFSANGLPIDDAKLAQALRGTGTDADVSASVWSADLAACDAYGKVNARCREKLPLLVISERENLNLQRLRYRRKGGLAWRVMYFPKPLRSRTEPDEQGNMHTSFWGEIYFHEHDAQKPWLMHTSKVFPNKFTTRDYDVNVERRPQDNVVQHGRFLFRLIAEAQDARELDVHLLAGIGAVLRDRAMQPVPRAWVLKRLVHALAENFGAQVPESQRMVRLVDQMRTDVPWMNPDHPDVLAAQEGIEAIFEQFPPVADVIQGLARRRALLLRALSRRVRAVGIVYRGTDGALEPSLGVSQPSSVWIVQTGAAGAAPRLKIAARERAEEGALHILHAARRDLFPGQVLFAPSDSFSEAELVEKAGYPGGSKPVEWPGSWPINAR